MCQALGGEVRANPKGTEIGIARDIERSAGAKTHAILLSLFRTAELQGHQPVNFAISLTKAAIAGQSPPLTPETGLKQVA